MAVQFKWTDRQREVLRHMGFPHDSDTVDEDRLANLEEMVSEHLQLHGLADGDELNEVGLTCETILDEIAKV
jgi:hypothetical protein